MLKMLFLRMSLAEIYRLHAYNNSSISQLGICRITIKHKNVELPCNFLVLPGNGPAILKCQIIKNLNCRVSIHNKRHKLAKVQINQESRHVKSCINND